MMLKNYMEILVEEKIDSILKNFDMCKCDICKLDIQAMALNNIAPVYIVSKKGVLYAKLNSLQRQFEVDVTSEIVKAAKKVKNNPRHDRIVD